MTIASEISRLQGAKADICTAIENKGVTVGNITLDNYASCIDNLATAKYVTQAEYDALPSSKLTDGIPYVIMSGDTIVCIIRNGKKYEVMKKIDYIVVGGGGGGAPGVKGPNGTSGGGGGGGEVLYGTMVAITSSYNISIGAGGCGGNLLDNSRGRGCDGGNTVFGNLTSKGGEGGYSYNTSFSDCCQGMSANIGGHSGSGCIGGCSQGCSCWCNVGGGGGGAGGPGGDGTGTCIYTSKPGNGGLGICTFGGGGGGGGWRCESAYIGFGCCGGGNGGHCKHLAGYNATRYGGGGGGGGSERCSSATYVNSGGNGCQGTVIVCYKTDGSCGISCATGGTVTTASGYTVHTFTTDGTFTIVS